MATIGLSWANIYNTSAEALNNELVEQLPSPFILLGDFNAHSPTWGDHRLDEEGKLLEKFISLHNLCVLNSGQHSFLSQ